jgi:hypothetical protein
LRSRGIELTLLYSDSADEVALLRLLPGSIVAKRFCEPCWCW